MGAFVLALVTLTSFAIYRVVDRSLHEQVDDFLRDRVESVSARLNEQRRDLLRGIRVRNPLGEALLDTRFDVVSQVISPTGEVLFLVGENDIPVTPSDIAVATAADCPGVRPARRTAGRVCSVAITGITGACA